MPSNILLSPSSIQTQVLKLKSSPQCSKMGDIRCITKGHYVVCPTHKACHSPRHPCVQCEEAQHRREKSQESQATTVDSSDESSSRELKKSCNKKDKKKSKGHVQQTIKQQRKQRQRQREKSSETSC